MDVLSISSRTAYMWRMKIFKVAGEMIKGTMLSNKVWIDEKLISVNNRYLVTKTNGNRYAEIIGNGHISYKQCLNSYGKHIKVGSHIIHDGIFSHDRLIKELKATDEIWKSIVKESNKHMQPINTFCGEIERNLIIHIGSRTETLQDYLNWIVFRSTINDDNIDIKVDELESKCFQSRVVYRIKDRYHQ